MNKKSSGCIYTRGWVVNFMLDICGYKKEKDLTTISVIEPSCGEGSFVVEIVERLCHSAYIYKKSIDDIKKSIKAYEIDENALNKTKEKTFSILKKYNYSYDEAIDIVNNWFHNSNFILDATNKADLIIGNPPYIRATNLSKANRDKYISILETFTQGTDLYIAFMEKGVKLLKPHGKLCFICSDRWQKNQYGTKFRNFIEKNNYHISFNCQMHDVNAFDKDVTAYPAISIIEQEKGFEKNIICNELFAEKDVKSLLNNLYNNEVTENITYRINKETSYKYHGNLIPLEDAGIKLGIGIATGRDKVFITDNPNCVESSRLLPLAYARDIRNFSFENTRKWMINPWEDGKLVDLELYPKLKKYLEDNKDVLSKRHVAKKNPNAWYRTIDKIKNELIGHEKLLIKDLSLYPEPIFEKGSLYPHHNLYWLMSDEWDIKVLGGILISDIIREMMEDISIKMHGGVIRNQVQYLRKLKVPSFSSISDSVRNELIVAFKKRDRKKASEITEKLYKRG